MAGAQGGLRRKEGVATERERLGRGRGVWEWVRGHRQRGAERELPPAVEGIIIIMIDGGYFGGNQKAEGIPYVQLSSVRRKGKAVEGEGEKSGGKESASEKLRKWVRTAGTGKPARGSHPSVPLCNDGIACLSPVFLLFMGLVCSLGVAPFW